MKKIGRCPRLLAPLALSLCLASMLSAAAPARADAPQGPTTTGEQSPASKIVVKVGDPIIIKDKKPAPKKK
jgi:hypothetical protein